MSQLDLLNPNVDLLKQEVNVVRNRISNLDVILGISIAAGLALAAMVWIYPVYFGNEYVLKNIYIPSSLVMPGDNTLPDPFEPIHQQLVGMFSGTLGKLIAGVFVLVGIMAGAVRGSLMGFAVGIGAAVGIANIGTILDSAEGVTGAESYIESEKSINEIYKSLSENNAGHEADISFLVSQIILHRYQNSKDDVEMGYSEGSAREEILPYYLKTKNRIQLNDDNANGLIAIEHFVNNRLVTPSFIDYDEGSKETKRLIERALEPLELVVKGLLAIIVLMFVIRFNMSSKINRAEDRFGDMLKERPRTNGGSLVFGDDKTKDDDENEDDDEENEDVKKIMNFIRDF